MKVEISLGELVDKVTILAIKLEKIKNAEKLANVRKEYHVLHDAMLSADISEKSDEYIRLIGINRQLWDIEDQIRIKESEKRFDDQFIALARSVYFTNDKRAAVKREINERYGSELVEEKEYVGY
jgi:hypothetical protein